MKILHVITSLRTGGAEHLLVDLLPRLCEAGHQVDLCILWNKNFFLRRTGRKGY